MIQDRRANAALNPRKLGFFLLIIPILLKAVNLIFILFFFGLLPTGGVIPPPQDLALLTSPLKVFILT